MAVAEEEKVSVNAGELARLNVKVAERLEREGRRGGVVKAAQFERASEIVELVAAACPKREFDAATEARVAVHSLGGFFFLLGCKAVFCYALARVFWVQPSWDELALFVCWGCAALIVWEAWRERVAERESRASAEIPAGQRHGSFAASVINLREIVGQQGFFFCGCLVSFVAFLLVRNVWMPTMSGFDFVGLSRPWDILGEAFINAPLTVNLELQRLGNILENLAPSLAAGRTVAPIGAIPDEMNLDVRAAGALVAFLLTALAAMVLRLVRQPSIVLYCRQGALLCYGLGLFLFCLVFLQYVPAMMIVMWPVVSVGPAYFVFEAYKLRGLWESV